MKRTSFGGEEIEFDLWSLEDVLEESEAQADFWVNDYKESVFEYLKRYKELLSENLLQG